MAVRLSSILRLIMFCDAGPYSQALNSEPNVIYQSARTQRFQTAGPETRAFLMSSIMFNEFCLNDLNVQKGFVEKGAFRCGGTNMLKS